MKIFSSSSNDPYINLAIEDHLLRSREIAKPFLFLYKNSPCVVWGRFQNPWIECNLEFLEAEKLLPVRRQSGGGCVYQDLGNLNFSFHWNEKEIHKKENAELIKKVLNNCGVNKIQINERHDLVIRKNEKLTQKFSGSAYKQTKDASFHHGTLLFESNLDKLEKSLASKQVVTLTKSIPSVRSLVTNLQEYGIKEESFLAELQNVCDEPINTMEIYDQEYYQTLKSDEWIWRETPEFKFQIPYKDSYAEICAYKGSIVSATYQNIPIEGLINTHLPFNLKSIC